MAYTAKKGVTAGTVAIGEAAIYFSGLGEVLTVAGEVIAATSQAKNNLKTKIKKKGKGVARNFKSSGGFKQTLKDFESLKPGNVKEIQTKHGPGKVGVLKDGTKVVARRGSSTGGPTLEIKVSNNKIYKIRY